MDIEGHDIKFNKIIKRLDFFSITFQFRVANYEKYMSFLGGISSIFYMIITLLYIIKSFFDFISFADKKIQFIQKYNSKDVINLTNKNFFYSFKFTYIEGFPNSTLPQKEENVIGSKYWDYFEIQNNYVTLDGDLKTKNKQLIKNCSEIKVEHFQDLFIDPKNLSDNEKPFDLTDHICFEYPLRSIYGQYADDKQSYIEIILKIKQKYFQENLNEIIDILQNVIFKFSFFQSDNIYDVSKLQNPVTKRINSPTYSFIDIFYYDRINIYLQNLDYSLDNYPLYKKPQIFEYINFSYFDISNSPMHNRFDPFSTFSEKYNFIKYFIRIDIRKSIINVTLMKIPEFLSGVSTISTNLFIIFKLIICYLNNFQAKQKIISKIMKFNDIIKINNKEEIDYLNKKINENNNFIKKSSFFIKRNQIMNKFLKKNLDC